MKTITDIVLEHADKIRRGGASTQDGIEFLELDNQRAPDIVAAANLYLCALGLINKLRK